MSIFTFSIVRRVLIVIMGCSSHLIVILITVFIARTAQTSPLELKMDNFVDKLASIDGEKWVLVEFYAHW
jgi:hypothetical protein